MVFLNYLCPTYCKAGQVFDSKALKIVTIENNRHNAFNELTGHYLSCAIWVIAMSRGLYPAVAGITEELL